MMKSDDFWRKVGLMGIAVLVLSPLLLAETMRKGETRGNLVLQHVQVEPVPLMTASSERYQVFWTMEEITGEEEGEITTGLTGEPSVPVAFSLSQNYPNPFNPSTTINFSVPEEGTGVTSLQIYDVRGRLLRTLVEEDLSSGNYSIHWDGKTDRGEMVSSGIYIYRLGQGNRVQTRKMTIVR